MSVILLLVSTIGSRLIALRRHPDTLGKRARFKASERTKALNSRIAVVSFEVKSSKLLSGSDLYLRPACNPVTNFFWVRQTNGAAVELLPEQASIPSL